MKDGEKDILRVGVGKYGPQMDRWGWDVRNF